MEGLHTPTSASSFIDLIEPKKHLVLLYNEPRYAKMLQYRFVINGLLKGEHVIVLTHDKTKFIEEEMFEHGINVRKYMESNLLHIYQTPDPTQHPNSNLDGSVLCTYDLNDILENERWQQWLDKLKNCHNAAIIQTRDGKESITVHN